MIQWLLFGLMLGIMLLRVILPIGQPAPGSIHQVVELGFRERLRLHRFNVYSIGAVMVLMALASETSHLLQFIVIAGVTAILLFPVRYRLTDEGIGLNNVVFRRWGEFRGLQTGERSFQLVGSEGAASFTIYATPRLHPEVIPALQDLLQGRTPKAESKRKERSY